MPLNTKKQGYILLFFLFSLLILMPTSIYADITDLSYVRSFDVSNEVSTQSGITFNDDGTKMYVLSGHFDGRTVYQYNLTTAYDISTASYSGKNSGSLASMSYPRGLAFNNDGTVLFVGNGWVDKMMNYTLSIAYDISTVSGSYSQISAQLTYDGINRAYIKGRPIFNSEGTKMFFSNAGGNDSIVEYSLSSAWDLSTLSYEDNYDITGVSGPSFTVISESTFSSSGTKMYWTNGNDDKIHEYTLSVGYDLSSTITYVNSIDVTAQDLSPTGLALKPDATKMFVLGDAGDAVYEYSGNTAPIVGHTSNNVLGTPTQDTDGTGNINIPFRVQDADTDNNTTKEWQYSDDGGTTWNDLVAGDMTGEDGNKSSATDWSGTEHTIVWNSQNQIDDTDQDDIQFAFRVNDGTVDSANRATTTSFTVDNLDPSVSYFASADNSTDIAIGANFEVNFNEIIATSTGDVVIYKTSDDSTVETIDITSSLITASSTTALIINPSSDLDYETEYYIMIDSAAVDDSFGNSYAGITASTTWSFTTEDTPPCPTIANAATYNAYPTCGIATCSDGYTLSDGACNISGGGAPPPPPSVGSGQIDSSIPMYKSKTVGEIKLNGTNLLMYIASNAGFTAKVSKTFTTQNHNIKILNLNMTTKKIRIEIQSEPKIVELEVGEVKDIDLDSDGISDITLSYNDLLVNRIDLTIEQLEFTDVNNDDTVYPEGSLIKEINNPTVFLIKDNKKRPFFNEIAFTSKNYKWEDVEEVSDLLLIPTGEMIYAVLDEEKTTTPKSNTKLNKYIFKYNLSLGARASDVTSVPLNTQ